VVRARFTDGAPVVIIAGLIRRPRSTTMPTEPEHPNVDVGQSAEERHSIIEELQRTSPEDDAPPPRKRGDGPTSDEEFAALQAQGLGSGALGTDPHAR
jgi:hypothetical protein